MRSKRFVWKLPTNGLLDALQLLKFNRLSSRHLHDEKRKDENDNKIYHRNAGSITKPAVEEGVFIEQCRQNVCGPVRPSLSHGVGDSEHIHGQHSDEDER